MIFILIGMLQCSKLSYDFYNSKHYQFSPLLGQESSKSGPSVYIKKEKKMCGKGAGGKLYQEYIK